MGEVYTLYYDDNQNIMFDEMGNNVFDIFRYVSPLAYYLFLKNKEYMCIETSPGCFVELTYPEDCDD